MKRELFFMYPYNIDHSKYSTSSVSASSQNIQPSKTILPPDKKILAMLEEAFKDEMKDAHIYKELISRQKTKTEAEIVRSIYLDELKHQKLFQEIYERLTGKPMPEIEISLPALSTNLTTAYEKSLFGELDAVEFYRQILFAILDLEIRDMLYEIITDEQKHATEFSYLYAKNRNHL